MTRFDAPVYVEKWQSTGDWPLIHKAISTVALARTTPGESLIDLGCSTGLLGAHMRAEGRHVAALDADGRAMGVGLQAGVFEGIPTMLARIQPTTMREVLDWIGRQAPTTILARRVFPELHDALGTAGLDEFADRLRLLGVQQIILEGRMPSNRMTHPLCTADREVAALSGSWEHVPDDHGFAHVRVLRARPVC